MTYYETNACWPIILMLYATLFLVACTSPASQPVSTHNGLNQNPQRRLGKTELTSNWWQITKTGCHLVVLPLTAEKRVNWHPLAMMRVFRGCLPDYADQIDLLILNCEHTKLGKAYMYSRDEETCKYHKRKFAEFQKQ